MNWLLCRANRRTIVSRPVSIARRQFVSRVSVSLVAAYSLSDLATVRAMCASQKETRLPASAPVPIVSFYIGQLYLDKTGASLPYTPAAGTRSGQSAAELSDAEFRSRFLYV